MMSNETFVNKLTKAFDLILNDVPDNRDDTINAKLVDMIRLKLSIGSRNDNDSTSCLNQQLNTYLVEKILTKNSSQLLVDKESDVGTFFIDLITLYLQSNATSSDDEFLNKTLTYCVGFFRQEFNLQNFAIESSVFCSLLELLSVVHDLLNTRNISESNPNELKVLFNQIILGEHLFGRQSVELFLDPQFKSIFVRKLFKKLLIKHLIYLITLLKVDNLEYIAASYDSLSTSLFQLVDSVKLSNLDIGYELLKHFLFTTCREISDEARSNFLLYSLKKFHFLFFKFESDNIKEAPAAVSSHSKYLIFHTNEILLNEHSIESFSYLLAIENLISFIDFDPSNNYTMILSRQNAYVNVAGSSVLFYDYFVNSINFICNCYATNETESTPIMSTKVADKRKVADLLFKFLVYSYSFLNELNSSSPQTLSVKCLEFLSQSTNSQLSIQKQIEAVKQKIFYLLTLPLSLKFNNGILANQNDSANFDSIEIKLEHDFLIINKNECSYLSLLGAKSANEKKVYLKFCLVNAKLFVRKFLLTSTSNDLIKYVNLNQLVYLLRHLDIDSSIKSLLLDFLIDYFSTENASNESRVYLNRLISLIVNEFDLKLDAQFNDSLFKLTSVCFSKISNIPSSILTKAIDSVNSTMCALSSSSSNQTDKETMNTQLIILTKFMTSLLKNISQTEFILNLLDSNNCFILKELIKCLELKQQPSYESEDLVNELKDATLIFLQNLFQVGSKSLEPDSSNYATLQRINTQIFTKQFFYLIEKMCLVETEAFSRRELIQFLSERSFYEFKSHLVNFNVAHDQFCCFNTELCNLSNFFVYFLLNEQDWQVQLNCLHFFEQIFEFISLNLPFNTDLFTRTMNNAAETSEFAKCSLADVLFHVSGTLKGLIKCINNSHYHDPHVVEKCCRLLLILKENERFMSMLSEICKKHNQLFQISLSSSYMVNMKLELIADGFEIAVGLPTEVCSSAAMPQIVELDHDNENYINLFMNKLDLSLLNEKYSISKQTGDLYAQNPTAILDDIINSYQFDIDNEKTVDCY